MSTAIYTPSSIDDTVLDLETDHFEVPASTPTSQVKAEFDLHPALAGAIVYDNAELLGVVSRDMLFRQLSRLFSLEIFVRRPIREFLEVWGAPPLRVTSGCTIHRAAEMALNRPLEFAYEPLLVEYPDGKLGLLHVHSLLMAQSQVLSLSRLVEEQRQAAEAASQAKSEFLANISHELRTPLHGIASYARFGLDDVESAERDELKDYFRKVDQCAGTLLNLVNDLLDLAKFEAGKMPLNLHPCELNHLMLQVVDEFDSLCSERDVHFQFTRYEQDSSIWVDAERLKQVFRNLISNAVKFSPKGGTITLGVRRVGKAMLVSVRDQGPGIPAEECEAIFDKFVQSSRTKSGSGGTGLGLAISREIVAAHRGRIWAENNDDRGAIFYCELPLGAPEDLEKSLSEAGASCDG